VKKLRSHLLLMRPKQWIKNLLVASVPLAAGQLFERKIVWQLGFAFLVFVLASAGTYVFNDLRDADRDLHVAM
jgi:decaprenyl-phosphate phosphoribosyltransferase